MGDWPVPVLTFSAILKAGGTGPAILPSLAAAPTVSSSVTADNYGSYTQIRGASGNAIYITGISLTQVVNNTVNYAQFKIGVGGAGSEVAVGETGFTFISGVYIFPIIIPIFPWIPVAASTRIAVAVADSRGNAENWRVKLFTFDQSNVLAGP